MTMEHKNSNEVEVSVLENIYCNIQKGLEMGKTLISLQGSSRSGKTFNVMIWLIMNALQTEYPLKISVVRRSLPSLKRSVLNDFKEIMIRMHQFEDKRFNKTEGIYTFRNGSIIEFFSTDDEQKVRGSKRDILFCNEANELTETEFKQLRMRTTKYCIIDYNPSFTEEHWIYPIRYDSRTYHFISTYRENIFLEQAIIDEIESYKYTNKALWQIYGMGEFAIIEGLVFPKENWDIIDDVDFPDWKGDGVLGIDWGMVNDPSVCVQALYEDKDIYVREIFREKGLKSGDIAKLLQPYKNFTKYCDIDNRLVEELELAGIPLLFMTKKNSMSIETGIRLLNQRKIHITASSTELIKEFKNYVFKKDRYDNWTNVPIDSFNHGIDALRYTALEEFKSSYDTKDGKMYMSKRDLGICF